MKLLVCDREEALSIGKDKFIDNGVLYLVYVSPSSDTSQLSAPAGKYSIEAFSVLKPC